MTDPSRDPYSKPATARRWVKVAVIVAIVVILLAVVMLVAGGGGHGPGRHGGGDAPEGHTPPAGVHAPPGGAGP